MWKLYALKGKDVWEVMFAPSLEAAAEALNKYFDGTALDPAELEVLEISELVTHYDGTISLDEYQKRVPVPIYFGHYNPADDQWVLPNPEQFEYSFGFKHPEMRYECDGCGNVFPQDEWVIFGDKRYCCEECA
jgi:hypothetical protein